MQSRRIRGDSLTRYNQSMKQTIRLPGEVPAKKNRQRAIHMPGNRIGILKADVVRDYEEMVWVEIIGQKIKHMEGPITLDMELVYKRNRDVDGALTTIMDCLQFAGVYDNDMNIEDARVTKRKAGPGEIPHALVTLEERGIAGVQ